MEKTMIRFNSDYTEGCHPAILKRLEETNMEQTAGYGEDEYCREAADRIKAVCEAPDANVHFLVGGTQTNVTVIASALRPYQGAITATTGHINVHETGALEACGYKCLTIDTPDGKLTAEQVEKYTKAHFADESFEHMVQPKLVYISNPTELGTIYKKAELEALYRVCRENDLYLFLDGARLGYGLACRENDLTMADIAANTDVFYIGGTKVGALFGEAVVITFGKMHRSSGIFCMHINPVPAPEQSAGLTVGCSTPRFWMWHWGEEFIAQTARIAEALLPVCVGRHPPSQAQ